MGWNMDDKHEDAEKDQRTEWFKRTQQFFSQKLNNVQKLNDFSPKTQGILAKTQFFGKSEILICRQPGQMETLV